MELKQLRTFITLAETLNFSRAAELLYVSQSTLSKQILALENELGATLLIRDTHSVVLTEVGALFLKHAREILNMAAAAEQSVRNFSPTQQSDTLTIGYDTLIDATVDLSSIILRLSFDFQKMCPDVKLNIISYPLDRLADALQAGLIDLAISIRDENTTPFENAAFNCVRVKVSRQVAAVNFKPEEDPDDLRALLGHYKVVYIPASQVNYVNLGILFSNLGIFPHVHFNDSLVDVINKVYHGAGFTIMPEMQFDKIKVEGIYKIPIDSSLLVGDIRLLWKKESTNRYIQEFVRVCVE